ncbi:MAG TPA: FAD-dependent monooxygenase [Pseudolabrys sp.]|nr:FAD-dependent monooxygenase [Pseudolabrys sp.]
MTNSAPILIVGGGIGGLAAALALGRKGWPVKVLEETPEFGAIGYGIQLGPNVFHMFERLGITQAVLKKAIIPKAVTMLDSVDGAVIVRVPTETAFQKRFKYPYVVLHRVDLHQILLDACNAVPTIELVPTTKVSGFVDCGDKIRLLANNDTIDGAAIIAADGLRSVIRQQLLNEGEPRMVGYVAHRTIVPMDQVSADVRHDESVLWSGPGFHMVHYPLRDFTLFNIVAVFKTSTYAERGDPSDYRAEIDRTYRNSHPTMKALLAMMDLGRRWAISDRDPIRHWSKGRVGLLGDAAHPTLQSLAQGACMAIEDAVCLAELIEQADGDFPAAFRRYSIARYVRTARVQFESRFMWDHFYHVDDIARDVMRASYADKCDEDLHNCLAWLYDGFTLPKN